MFFKSAKHQFYKVASTTLLISTVFTVFAGKYDSQPQTIFSPIQGTVATVNSTQADGKSTPNSFVTLDFSVKTAESWDLKDSANNMISHCIDGDVITGVEFTDVTIQTEGNSFFSEAVIYFSDTNDQGLKLQIGSGNETSGTAVFNSNGMFDITDSGNVDVVSLSDKKFMIQFLENIDDNENQIDARYTNGVLKVWGVDLTATDDCPFTSSTNSGGVDLVISYTTASTGPISIGDTIIFNIVVTNGVPNFDVATGVVIQNIVSPHLEYSEFSCDDGTLVSSPDSIASVNVNNIPLSGVLSCTLETTVISAGRIESSVTVSSATFDIDNANNSAPIVLAGASVIVPFNSTLTLVFLVIGMFFFARRFNKV